MRALLIVCLFAFLCISGARASCINDFVECIRNQPDKQQCVTDLKDCANSKCSCFDIASVSTVYCAMKANTTTEVKSCLAGYLPDYSHCIQTCKQAASNFTGLHATQGAMIPLLPMWSKFTICTKVVSVIEKFATSKGCSLVVGDFSAICDFLAPVCYVLFKQVCSIALKYILSHPGVAPADVCKAIGFGPSSLTVPQSDVPVSAAVMVDLTSDALGEFVDRFSNFPEAAKSTNSSCWPSTSGVDGAYTCMEEFKLASTSSSDASGSSSSSSSESTWAVVAGVFAILTFATALITLFVVYRRKQQHSTNEASNYAAMNNNF